MRDLKHGIASNSLHSTILFLYDSPFSLSKELTGIHKAASKPGINTDNHFDHSTHLLLYLQRLHLKNHTGNVTVKVSLSILNESLLLYLHTVQSNLIKCNYHIHLARNKLMSPLRSRQVAEVSSCLVPRHRSEKEVAPHHPVIRRFLSFCLSLVTFWASE
jgi:hypothetical protein